METVQGVFPMGRLSYNFQYEANIEIHYFPKEFFIGAFLYYYYYYFLLIKSYYLLQLILGATKKWRSHSDKEVENWLWLSPSRYVIQ